MNKLSKYRVFFSIAVAVFILVAATGAIFYARGFKPNFKNGKIDHTGLIVAKSMPTGAQLYLDGRLTSATDTSIAYLSPKSYDVKIVKDGYNSWEKRVDVKADLATEINALLFPQAPEIKPLTTTGAAKPALSPDGSRIVYGTTGERGGLYAIVMSGGFIPFQQNARLLAKNQGTFDFSKSTFTWSPDSKQLIASFYDTDGKNTSNLLIDSDKSDQDLRDITGSLAATYSSWQDQINQQAQTLAVNAPDAVKTSTAEAKTQSSPTPSPLNQNQIAQQIIKSASPINYFPNGMMFSPDQDKILYFTREAKYKIYDLKIKKEYTLPDFADLIKISWFPDSDHIIILQKNQISIIETDGTNKTTVFTGSIEDSYVFAHPSATRIIILTHLTQTEGTPPNLYSINLR